MKTAFRIELYLTERIAVRVAIRQSRLHCEPGMNFQMNEMVKTFCIADCINGTPKLVGGSTDSEGRVEVCVGGRWGTVQTN